MSFLYITECGSFIKVDGGKVAVEQEGKRILEIPKNTLEGLVVLSSVQISSQAIIEFLKLGISVAWVSQAHKNYGRLITEKNINVMRHARQAVLQDSEFSLKLGKRIVAAKVHNQKVILRRYNRNRDNTAVDGAIKNIEIFSKSVCRAADVQQLMGYEGIIARNYFSALGQMVPSEFAFDKRTRRPPQDYFNAMLSLGYSLLFSEIYTAVSNEGLHPYFGFLHKLKDHHAALVSDLMEEWRPVLVDSMVMSLDCRVRQSAFLRYQLGIKMKF